MNVLIGCNVCFHKLHEDILTEFMWHKSIGVDNNSNYILTFDRLWIWLSEVPGAPFDLFAWNHYFQGFSNTRLTLRNWQDCSQNRQNPAEGISNELISDFLILLLYISVS